MNENYLDSMKYSAFGLTLETKINFDGVLQKAENQTDVLLKESEIVEKTPQLTRNHRRGIHARFGRNSDSIILNWKNIGKFKISDGKYINYQNLGADEETLKLFLLSEVIGIILLQRGFFLLHASAVEVGGRAFVFAGASRAGKSTTATAFGKAGFNVLTDDMTAISLIDSKPFVVPGFAQYKVWKSALDGLEISRNDLPPSFEGADKFLIKQNLQTFPQKPVPLEEINILFSPKARIKEKVLNPVLAPVELLKHFSLPIQMLTPDYLQKHFRQSLEIAQSVPIKLIKRAADFEKLEEFVQTLAQGF